MNLDTPLTQIKGVGVKTADSFEKAGITTVRDLMTFFPRKYEDYSKITPISALKPGKVSLKVAIEGLKTRRVRRGLHITEATLVDDTGKVAAVWFNQPYRADQLRKEKGAWLVSGEFGLQGHKYQITNPSVEKIDSRHVNTGRIVPVYPAVSGLKSHIVRKLLLELQPLITMLEDPLPANIVRSHKLVSYTDAISYVHFPASSKQIDQAKHRLGFDELFALVLAAP